MKISFHRGVLERADGSPSALSFHWSEESPIGSLREGVKSTPIEVELLRMSDDLYTASHQTFRLIALAKTPWWTELPSPFADRGVWLSYQGFSEGIWHDGIFGRFEEGRWTDIVMPGGRFTLEFGRSQLPLDDPSLFFKDEKFFAQKQSLVQSIKALHPQGVSKKLSIGPVEGATHADFVLGLMLYRVAFPRAQFSLFPESVGWKRLAQNLNIEVLKSPVEIGVRVQALGPHEKVFDLLRWQQSRSPFIPQNLMKSL